MCRNYFMMTYVMVLYLWFLFPMRQVIIKGNSDIPFSMSPQLTSDTDQCSDGSQTGHHDYSYLMYSCIMKKEIANFSCQKWTKCCHLPAIVYFMGFPSFIKNYPLPSLTCLFYRPITSRITDDASIANMQADVAFRLMSNYWREVVYSGNLNIPVLRRMLCILRT